MCVAIETQLAKKFVNKVGDYVFENWSWVSNTVDSNRGCRIMVGWDRNVVGANLISQSDQPLWKNLADHCLVVNNEPRVVLGDFNVTLNVDESSNSFGVIDKDMDVFRKVLFDLCLDDIISYGMVNGNVFDKVKVLRVELKRVQTSLDKEPDNIHLREKEYVYCRIEEVYDAQDGLFIKKLDSQCADSMVRPVLDDEIKHAMFSIEDDKAAGPDGFSSRFFKAAWSVIGSDVCAAVKEFFASSKLLGEFNANLISLVPKLKTPLKITDYRPIACGNVVYKCISKVIVNRLKEGLGSIIDCNQSAFILGRQISDNILLAQEFVNGYSCKGGALKCAFKVDIEKAYDTVSWDFLKTALIKFGFHASMIKWIMVCLTTASFSICINGAVHGFFKGKRGLRQGDPMSPYLFTIVMEVFNLMVQRQIRLDDRFKYQWVCRRIKLTHLCFADDLLMLCHGDLISASILRRALDEFSMSSGLYPNMSKSTTFYGNVPESIKGEIHLVMPFRVLVEKVKNRILDWRNKSLSLAGKLQLVASVLSSLHVYWASMFILPVFVCDSIDKLLKNFVWSKDESGKGIASVAWKD
ncbi:RNA-directed DNA polymerase, eukaryota, reverse transcriptase zinc-binding domain protein, partial [Tanacetum coccineum]